MTENNLYLAELDPERCYVCGRKPDDFPIALNATDKKRINGKMSILHQKMYTVNQMIAKDRDVYAGYLQKLVSDAMYAGNLNFTVATVETDIAKFARMIPRLSDLLQFALNKDEKITCIIDRIRTCLTEFAEGRHSDYFDKNASPEKMAEREKLLAEHDVLEAELCDVDETANMLGILTPVVVRFHVTKDGTIIHWSNPLDLASISPDEPLAAVEVRVSICPVCAQMHYKASKAAELEYR